MANNKTQCASCGKNKATSICIGCSQNFCSKHFTEHRQQLSSQLDEIEQQRDLFQQTLNQHTTHPQNNLLIEQVNQWEHQSIQIIKQTAQEIRQTLSHRFTENINLSKIKLDQLTQQLRESREEDEIIEGDLHTWNEQLKQLTQQLNTPTPNIILRQTQIPLVNKMQIEFEGEGILFYFTSIYSVLYEKITLYVNCRTLEVYNSVILEYRIFR